MSRTGVYEAQLGMDAALERIEATAWLENARHVIAGFCASGRDFTAEDLRDIVGDPPTPNSIGALFGAISGEKWIRRVGSRPAIRPDAHGRWIGVWRAST